MQSLHPGNSSYQVNAPGAPNSKHHCPACRVSWGSDLLRQICLPSGCPANLKKDRVCLIEALFRDGGFSSKGVPHNNRTFSWSCLCKVPHQKMSPRHANLSPVHQMRVSCFVPTMATTTTTKHSVWRTKQSHSCSQANFPGPSFFFLLHAKVETDEALD